MADWPPKKNAAFTVTFPIYDADGDLVSAAASLDSEVSKDGGTFTDVSPGEATELATASGVYTLALSATEMNADIVATITKTATGGAKTAVNVMYTVTRQLVDLAYPATSGRSLQVETDGHAHADVKEWLGVAPNALVSGRVDSSVGAMAANVLTDTAINTGAITAAKFAAGAIDAAAIANAAIDAATFAAGAIDSAAIAANAIGSSEIATGAITSGAFAAGAIDAAAIANAAIDAATFAAGAINAAAIATDAIDADALAADAIDLIWDELLAGHTTLATFGQLFNSLGVTGEVADAGPLAGDFDVDGFTEVTDNHFNGHVLVFTSGVLRGQGRIISTYTGAAQNCAFDRPFTEAPTDNDDFVILGPLAGGLGRLIATESDGHAHADLKEWLGVAPNALQSGRVDAYGGAMAADVITAAAIANGAIDAATFVAGAVDAAALNADAALEIADAVFQRDIDQVEASAPVHSLTTAVLKAVSRIRDNAGTLEIYRTNAVTIHASQTVTEDATLDPIDELSVST